MNFRVFLTMLREEAGQDEDVMGASTAYDAARQQLRAQQRQRGFFKKKLVIRHAVDNTSREDRKAAIESTKEETTQICHWAGDALCPKKSSPKSKMKARSSKENIT